MSKTNERAWISSIIERCADRTDVTVLMPVYNGAQYLEDQLRSILEQEDVTLRLVVVDDGSTDASLDILYKFRPPLKNSRLRGHPGASVGR